MCKGYGLARKNDASLTVVVAREAVRAAYRALEARRQEINDLNVYPVPDGDTGTNLSLTVKSIVEMLDRLDEESSPAEIAQKVAESALMGARGNSGVILSQIVRGGMEVLKNGGPLDTQSAVEALEEARDAAYRAVRKPVEGTMLTVIKDMAASAEKETERQLVDMWRVTVAAGWESVRNTPSLLAVLRDAGVVDAGGHGLVTMFEGMLGGDAGEEPVIGHVDHGVVSPRPHVDEETSRFTYCTSALISGDDMDPSGLEIRLAGMGDSLLVVSDGHQMKFHIHTDEPGDVLNLALAEGVVSSIEVDNMREQTAERDERLRAGESKGRSTVNRSQRESAPRRTTDILAVVTGEGNTELYRSMGVDFIVQGGQSMNPSAEELLQVMEDSDADAIILLPNNSNIVMTAEHAAAHAKRPVFVLPSHSIQAGLSALVAYEPSASGEDNLAGMQGILDEVRAGEVTRAVRDSKVDDMNIKSGAFIGLVEGHVVVTSADLAEVVVGVASRLLTEDTEVLTVLLGDGDIASDVERAVVRMKEELEGLDVEVYEGGQALYPILMAAE